MVFSTLWISQIISYQLDGKGVDPSHWLNHLTTYFIGYLCVEYGVKVTNSMVNPSSKLSKEVLMGAQACGIASGFLIIVSSKFVKTKGSFGQSDVDVFVEKAKFASFRAE
tara:strand:+ start:239 stop:568 length:330 start_codon:yes stop_codon:yes gene_type:complete